MLLPPSDPATRRTGYVLKRYPRLSETFILHELLAREAAGERLAIAALHRVADPHFHADVAAVRAPVFWVPELRNAAAPALWEAIREAWQQEPRVREVLPELLAADVDDAAQALHVARWAREQGLTHLHAHFATSATTVARLASFMTGIPYSFTAHAKDVFHQQVDVADLGRKIRNASHVVTVSEHNVDHLVTTFPEAAEKVHLVRNGLPLRRVPWTDPAPREARIAFVGRLVEKKGVPDLLDAVAVLAERGHRVPVDLVGTGPLEDELRREASALGVDDLVAFHGARTQGEVHAVLAGAAAFAAPCVVAADGDRDGLPTVLLEAMALGTPCVSTPVTGIPEAVRDGETGLLVPERDPVALADALERLLENRCLRSQLAAAARAHVEGHYDVDRQAAQLAELQTRATATAVAGAPSAGSAAPSSSTTTPSPAPTSHAVEVA